MGLHAVKLLEISVTTDSKKKILEEIEKYLGKTSQSSTANRQKRLKPLRIVTPNPEQVVLAAKNSSFANIINQADVAIPDGIGLVWASRLVHGLQPTVHGKRIQHRIPGVEFMRDLASLASRQGYSIGLIGGRGSVAVDAFECLTRVYPGLRGWALEAPELETESMGGNVLRQTPQHSTNATIQQFHSGALKHYVGKVIEKIVATRTRVVFIGLGAPKQEFLAEALSRQISDLSQSESVVLMSVGGSFDVLAGIVPRAPLVIRLIGFEWLWRLVIEPWRWKRQVNLLTFVQMVIEETFRKSRAGGGLL